MPDVQEQQWDVPFAPARAAGPAAGPTPTDDELDALYAAVVRFGPISAQGLADLTDLAGPGRVRVAPARIRPALAELAMLRLVVLGTRDLYLAVNPDIATETLAEEYDVSILEQEANLNRRRQEVASLKARITVLRRTYHGARADWADDPAFRTVSGTADTRSLFDQLLAEGRHEVMACHPDLLYGGWGSRPIERASLLAARGVELRVLWRHTARFDGAAVKLAEAALAAGIGIRTTAVPPPPMAIVDRSAAIVRPPDGEGSVIIREPTTIAVLTSVFENAWHDARPLRRGREPTREALGEIRLKILQLLAEGLTDKAVAARLGIAERTCREHVAVLYEQFRVKSRFQAGVAARAAGLVNDP